jgi:hypothetical protein
MNMRRDNWCFNASMISAGTSADDEHLVIIIQQIFLFPMQMRLPISVLLAQA